MPDQSSAASEHALLQEITAPLETLPDDPLALVEAEFPTTMRGYDRHAVDDYVDQVSRLVAELHATRSPEAAVRRALERVGDQISGILQRAHETAEQITAQSRIEAEDRLEQARREAATMVDAAAQRVRELDADADRIWAERQRIIADAEDLSGQLRAVTREAAERFPPADEARASPAGPQAMADAGPLDPEVAPAEEPEGIGVPDDDWSAAEAGLVPADAGDVALDVAPDVTSEALSADADPAAHEGASAARDPEEAEDPGDGAGGDATIDWPAPADAEDRGEPVDDDIEATRRFAPQRLTDDDSTQIIPPASDAAQHRRDR
jgi:DivIVA domain-containing protein